MLQTSLVVAVVVVAVAVVVEQNQKQQTNLVAAFIVFLDQNKRNKKENMRNKMKH